jgi:hypothetical protein
MSDGRIYARFAQTSHREFPLLGGVSVLAESIPLLDDILVPAELLIQEIGLDGPSMVEFRRDEENRPVLMEVNPRMGGSVQLAVRSGVDFPMMTYEWATGARLNPVADYRTGQRLRWLSGDIRHLKTAMTADRNLDVPSRASALVRFVADFALRPAALDPFAFDDLLPALMESRENLISPFKRKVSSLVRRPVGVMWKLRR